MANEQLHVKRVLAHEAMLFREFEWNGLTPRIHSLHRLDSSHWELQTERYPFELGDYLRVNPDRIEMMKQLAHEQLHRLHLLGYAHGGIHLGNFLVKQGHVALIDFESSYLVTNATRATSQHLLALREHPYSGCEEPIQQAEHSMLDMHLINSER